MTWATSVPISVFLSLSVLCIGPMYATDGRQTDVRCASSLNDPTLGAGPREHNNDGNVADVNVRNAQINTN